MRPKTVLPAILLLLTTTLSCSQDPNGTLMEKAHTIMDEDPETALIILESISEGWPRTRKSMARHALLRSIALDKNCIDITDDSLINIAVRWYRHHGTADDKLKAYYYQGRVYQNAGYNEKAMECFVKAEKFSNKAKDNSAVGRLYKAQAIISFNILDHCSGIKYAQKAADNYFKSDDIEKYASSLISIANGYLVLNKTDSCKVYLEKISKCWDRISDLQKSLYYENLISLNEESSADIQAAIIKDYIAEVKDSSLINWCKVAYIYLLENRTDEAQDALKKYPEYDSLYEEDPVYHYILASMYEQKRNFLKATECYKRYFALSENNNLDIISQDTKFIRERYTNRMKESKLRYTINIALMVLLVIILCSTIAIMKTRREKDKYTVLYSKAIIEKETLKNALKAKTSINQQTRHIISSRLALLDKFISAHITGDITKDREACKELADLIYNKNFFLDSTRISVIETHPEFISYLMKRGLTKDELDYCCLYLTGLNGKQIGSYIGLQRHYVKFGNPIREKLGLGTHDKNLGPYLRSLADELDNKRQEQ